MLPRLDIFDAVDPLYQTFANELAGSLYRGEINCQYSARLAVATDNSVYQQLPQLVLHPRTIADIQAIMSLAKQAKFHTIKFSARGGGTGTNGQSLTPGIVVDLSKYMNRILKINVEQGWVEVEAGVVKDQLNAFLKPYGFFFAPDLSTSNRATIGGMINTDASGQGSLVYGKTSDHVLALEAVLANGEVLHTKAMPTEVAEIIAEQNTSEGQLIKAVLTSCKDNRAAILAKFPRMNRFLTGYDLEHVFNDDLTQFDLGRVITGSEGSLAVVCKSRLNITPLSKAKALVNIKYDSFNSALRHAPSLVAAKATSVETIDSRVLNLAKQDIIWHSVSELIQDVPNQVMDGINIVEYNANSKQDIEQKIQQLEQMLATDISQNKGVIGYQITYDADSIGKIYAMRKKAVGLLGNAKGDEKPLAFAEDTAVPPENLADFIAEFRALLDSYQLDYGMFGHVDAGVLHVRPALNMCDPEQEKLLRILSDQVVKLTAKYGGLMWGEHGKGYRSEYGPEFFGEQLFTELRKIKAAFDPHNQMNPGKICTPINSDEQLVSVDGQKRGYFDRQIPTPVKQSFAAVMNCNGNGLCFNYEADSPMCPSSKITRDRRHSPKGRAGLMREWLRLLEQKGVDIFALEQSVNQWSVKRLLNKVAGRLTTSTVEQDFSHEVKQAMDGCLACKACASQCPIKVDVPDFRARFINLYHSRYPRPMKDHLVANIETLAPVMAKMPKVVNGVVGSKLFKRFSEQQLGYKDMPMLSVPSLQQQLAKANYQAFNLAKLQQLGAEQQKQYVLVVQDPFTSFYDASVVVDLMKLIKQLGFQPMLVPFKPNGKAQHVKGFLTRFAKTAQSTADFLNQLQQLNIAMIGCDASTVLCYRDEYKQILGDKRGNFNVLLAHEWLIEQREDLQGLVAKPSELEPTQQQNQSAAQSYYLFSHCTEKTALPKSEQQWQTIFSWLGQTLNIQSVGCCGMAGTYGHESQNQSNSLGLFDLSWQAKLNPLNESEALVTGFSCRSQVKRFAGMKVKHPLSALVNLLS